jgi:hypothetical protein
VCSSDLTSISTRWVSRGGRGIVRVNPKDKSTISAPIVFETDPVGCGNFDHIKFQQNITLNELNNSHMNDLGSISVSGVFHRAGRSKVDMVAFMTELLTRIITDVTNKADTQGEFNS